MEEMNNNVTSPNGGEKKGLAIASLVLGIVSVVFMCLWYIGIPCAILGLVFGILSNKAKKNGMATAGIVLSIIGFLLVALLLILVIAGITSGTFAGIMSSIQ